MVAHLVSAIVVVTTLSAPRGIDNLYDLTLVDEGVTAATPGEATEPLVLALELGRLGDDNAPPPGKFERGGNTNRVFGPVHPSSRYGTFTGRGTGAYTGRGTGSYTGGGLGRIETFGLDQPNDVRNGTAR
jgi:hypothetical protein